MSLSTVGPSFYWTLAHLLCVIYNSLISSVIFFNVVPSVTLQEYICPPNGVFLILNQKLVSAAAGSDKKF